MSHPGVLDIGDEALAIGWITALKIIPWGDVVEAAPHIVKAAKRLFATTKDNAAEDPVISPTPASASSQNDKFAQMDERVLHIQAKVDELGIEQKTSAELIKSLAEQNVRVVEAIEILRIRTKVLIIACVSLGIALAALALWVAMQ
ncbi:MAG: hypothetical protein K0M66_08265 [Thiobacillus sp.]|nr:hypothetical protein [Thiobacillus sp.]